MIRICSLAAFLLVSSNCYADGLDALIDLGRGQAAIQSAYQEETKQFERVKDAVDDGDIKKGDSAERIKEKYGEPVAVLNDSKRNREDWIYKPASSEFFGSGSRIDLCFDEKGTLDEIKKIS